MNNALKTWYPVDHPKHFDPIHPALKLAGETGELIDLIAKGMFKPGFDVKATGKDGLPLLDSELGDWSYYQRILEYLRTNSPLISLVGNVEVNPDTITKLLIELNYATAHFVYSLILGGYFNEALFREMKLLYDDLLDRLGLEYEDILQQNYWKLNEKDDNAHGWKNAK